MPRDFVHLHVHSEFSLLDGMSKIGKLVKKTKEYGSTALAITDHGVMHGAIDFYKTALREEIKPILGCEIYMSAGSRLEKKRNDAFHLTVLARDLEGYQNLMKIVTIGQTEGYYYRPRVDKDTLARYSKGLMATSGCPAGLIQKLLMSDGYDAGKEVAKELAEIFRDSFYIELQRHPFAEFAQNSQVPAKVRDELTTWAETGKKTEEMLIRLSRELGLPMVATNDVHYVEKDDAVAQDAIVCIQTGKTIADVDRLRYIDTPTYYLKSPEEMEKVYLDLPEAIDNTVKMAEKVDIKITLGQWFFPKFELPEGKTPGEVLREMAEEGAVKLFPEITDEIRKRIDFEMEVIDGKGYSPYFLIFADMTRFSRETGIYINTRGSAAGSLVSYCCGITTVDPLRYNLPFERFLNPLRPSAPDIDLDISDDRREDMIAYLKQRYGEDKVAQICTFGTMQARGSVRDVGRVLGMPYSGPDRISKMIPLGKQGFPMTIKKAIEITPELKAAYDGEEDTRKLLDLAKKIEGNARHISVHAAGVVVSPTELTDFTPLQKEPGGGDKIITQYEMHACEDVGLVKMDILGIRNLSILANAIKIIGKVRGEEVDIYKIPIDDSKTFEMLAKGETFGVFQMGSPGMTKHLMDLQPTRVEDLMIMVALYRPGPMANISEFIARKKGLKEVEYYHPKMESFLGPSLGVLVYQDDLLSTALELAGYNWESVDKFRKAVGKKIPEEMAKQHVIFVEGCQQHSQMSKDEAEGLWKLFEPFQGYGFNKAHAASYGMVSYWTAYLKAHYPVEYMTALLTAKSAYTDKLTEAIAECEKIGIKIMPPSVNQSLTGFTIVEIDDEGEKKRAIRFGLSAIKNVGEAAIGVIVETRSEKTFTGLGDFCRRVDQRKCNKRVLESLIKVGAMDEFGDRAALMAGIDVIRGRAETYQKVRNSGQQDLFGSGGEEKADAEEKEALPDVPTWELKEKLKYEKELLGFYLSANPLKNMLRNVEEVISHKIKQLDAATHLGQTVTLAGVVSKSRQVNTKKNNSAMAFGTFEDDSGAIEAVVFPEAYEKYKNLWQVDKALVIKGKVDVREDALNLVVNEVEEIDEDAVTHDVVELEIPRGTDKEVLQKINGILKANPGDRTVIVIIPNGGEPRRIKLGYGVDYSEAVDRQIRELLVK